MAKQESLGAFVKRNRKARGWTQEVLAEKAGIKQSYVSGIERSVNVRPEPPTLLGLARAFDLPASFLMGLAGYPVESLQTGPEVQVVEGMILRIVTRAGEYGTPLNVSAETIRLLLAHGIVQEQTTREAGND